MNKKKSMDLFIRSVLKYMEIFGMKDWEVFCEYSDDKESRATCSGRSTNRVANFILSSDWIKKESPIEMDIDKVAFHEVCELFLWGMRLLAEGLYNTEVVDKEIHVIIRTLENIMFFKDRHTNRVELTLLKEDGDDNK